MKGPKWFWFSVNCVFGVVIEGMDVVDQIADVATENVGPYQDVPLEVITIESVTISE